MALVSVVIPTFNRAYCLARTLDSVLAQTHAELEILLVDGGSTDETPELVRRRYGTERRVHYIAQANAGVAAARNHGIRLARGEFLALLDSDDVWQPWKLELQLRCLRQFPELGMVWTDMEAIDPNGRVFNHAYIRSMYSTYALFPQDRLFPQSVPLRSVAPSMEAVVGAASLGMGMIFLHMIMGNLVDTSTVLIRRGEDFDFHLRTCRHGPVGFLDLPTIQYQRGMPDRLTRSEYRIHTATNFLRTITPFIESARSEIHLPRRMIEGALADAHEWIGELQFEANDMAAARSHLFASIRHRWWQRRAWELFVCCYLPAVLRGWLRAHRRHLRQRTVASP